MRVKDKVAIVTGGGSGLGKAIATRLAGDGAAVVVADVNEKALNATVQELTAAGHKALAYKVDVSDRERLKDLMDVAVERFGRIDILVNNAGVTRHRPFLELNDADWDFVLAVDLKGVFFCVQAVATQMIRQGYGKILNISSASGTGASSHHAGGSAAGNANYASAKAGVIQLTKTLARELGPHGINVNAIAPGFVLTPMTGASRSPDEIEEHIAVRRDLAVLKRTGKPEDIANAVLFLVSDEASFITGQTLYVDGGRTDRM
ncbi:MAG: 3-oxoacyl-ACP reductase FabG [Burkholderiales bacterium]|nr:3-oxoacyl-ACP reductase FabG [Burkholderiales bacterium]